MVVRRADPHPSAPLDELAHIIRSQQRGTVSFHGGRGKAPDQYRWTVVLDGEKTSHGWADSEAEAWWFVREALNRPHRGTRYRRPRGLFGLPPT